MSYRIVDGCTGCSRCAALCPVRAISGTIKQPFLINEKRCVECGVCARSCAKSVIVDRHGQVPPLVPRKLWPVPIINSELCSACGICVDACGMNALDISRPQYSGDYHVYAILREVKKCVGCSLCVDECPLNAIKMEVCSRNFRAMLKLILPTVKSVNMK